MLIHMKTNLRLLAELARDLVEYARKGLVVDLWGDVMVYIPLKLEELEELARMLREVFPQYEISLSESRDRLELVNREEKIRVVLYLPDNPESDDEGRYLYVLTILTGKYVV